MRKDVGPKFLPTRPKIWTGRYKRVPGDKTAFHIRSDWPLLEWERDGCSGTCGMVESDAAKELAKAVKAGKRYFGFFNSGGAFLINEHGQVLVPSPRGDGQQVLVGEWIGPLEFENPFESGEVFDLLDDDGFMTGDPWDRPYVGIPYNLSKRDELYFWDNIEEQKLVPPRQDKKLITKLRRIRRWGSVRFLVLPKGIVVTKGQEEWLGIGESIWEAKYVGRIDFRCWFSKEE